MPNKHLFRKIKHAETRPDEQKYHKKRGINNIRDENHMTKYVFVLSNLNTNPRKTN